MDRQLDSASVFNLNGFEGRADESSLRTTYVADTSSQREVSYPDGEGARSLATCHLSEHDDTQTLVTVGGRSDTGTLHRISGSGNASARPGEGQDDRPLPSLRSRNVHNNATWSHQNSLAMQRVVLGVQNNDHPESEEPRAPVLGLPHQNPVSVKIGNMDNFAAPGYWKPRDRKRLLRELKDLSEYATINGTEGTPWRAGLSRVHQLDDFVAFFTGSEFTPYAGGVFYVRFRLTVNYPFKAPICKMLTKVYHPNIDSRGRICLDVLYDQFSPSLTFEKLVISISSVLHSPNAEDPLVPEIAEMYVRDRTRYNAIARDYTQRYATSGPPETVTEEDNHHSWWENVQIDQEERARDDLLLPVDYLTSTRSAAGMGPYDVPFI